MMSKKWRGVCMPGANLSYAQLCDSDLSGADLSRCCLFRANLTGANLSKCVMISVELMEEAPIKCKSSLEAVACHPYKPWILVVCSEHIRQYDTFACNWVGNTLAMTNKQRVSFTTGTYSADGKYIVSGSNDKTIRQWVSATGEQHGPVLQGHTEAVTSVSYSADGKYIVSGSYDNTVRQWVSAITHGVCPEEGNYNPNTVVWASRSARDPLKARGLCLSNVVGLQRSHIALLRAAGFVDNDIMDSTVINTSGGDAVVSSESSSSACIRYTTSGFVNEPDIRDHWVPDQASDICMLCSAKFTIFYRRHHCRRCGALLCGRCAINANSSSQRLLVFKESVGV
jgi:WD40 repeat protein